MEDNYFKLNPKFLGLVLDSIHWHGLDYQDNFMVRELFLRGRFSDVQRIINENQNPPERLTLWDVWLDPKETRQAIRPFAFGPDFFRRSFKALVCFEDTTPEHNMAIIDDMKYMPQRGDVLVIRSESLTDYTDIEAPFSCFVAEFGPVSGGSDLPRTFAETVDGKTYTLWRNDGISKIKKGR